MERGRGYIEKDWGRSFPSAWVWMQSNHFGTTGISLTASVASIPMARWRFRGFIVGLWHGGRLHRFTTYNGGKIERLVIDDRQVHWVLRNRTHRLEIRAPRVDATDLKGPSTSDMGVRVPESLSAAIEVRLCALAESRQSILFEGTGRHAGLEVAGDLRLLAGK